MADLTALDGYGEAAGVDDADLVILNTCHIRERASEKIYSELGKLRELKEERLKAGRRTTLVVAGCLAQAEGGEILRRQAAVDVVVGPQSYHRLPELLREAEVRSGVIDTEFPVEDKFAHLPPSPLEATARRGVAAFVTVQEGCDKFCSFCVVPYTRGAEASRPVGAVIDEIGRLARAGVREVTLIGQNVNAYHGLDRDRQATGLAGLIAAAAAVNGIRRVRYATSHPNDMDEQLIAAHRDIGALAPYLHLPIQSGSDRVLASMNRRHRVRDYLDIVAQIRAARSDIALSSDFIVGYPGETEADFDATLDLVRAVGYASFVFLQILGEAGDAGGRNGRTDRRCGQGPAPRDAAGASRRSAAGVQCGLHWAAPRGAVREAGPPRGPGRRPLSLYAGCACGGAAVAHRRRGRGRNRRDRPKFIAGPHCLASVVKTGFDRRAG